MINNEEQFFGKLLECDCNPTFSVEKQIDGSYILFFGRCPHKHGDNLVYLKHPAINFNAEYIENLLNIGLNEEMYKYANKGDE